MAIDSIRAFNDAGLKAFQSFIDETRAREKSGDGKLDAPRHLLTDAGLTEALGFDVQIDSAVEFDTRFDLAVYMNTAFDPAFDDALYARPGLWGWLALHFLDQLRGQRTQRSEHFVPDEWAKQTPGQDLGYRHSVRTPVQLLRTYGRDFARFFLTGRPTSEMGDIVEQVVSRPKLLGSERIRATMINLYQSPSGGFKRGAATRPAKDRKSDAGRGGLRRFAEVYVPRVKLGYDIDEMEVPEIVATCGPEISKSRFALS